MRPPEQTSPGGVVLPAAAAYAAAKIAELEQLEPELDELLELDADTLEHLANRWLADRARAARRVLAVPAHKRRGRGRKIEQAIAAAIKAAFLQGLADKVRQRRPAGDKSDYRPKLKHVLTKPEINDVYAAAIAAVKAETKDAPPTPAQKGQSHA